MAKHSKESWLSAMHPVNDPDPAVMLKQTLLVVDDCQSNLDVMHVLFDKMYTVVSCKDSFQALSLAEQHNADLILLDVDMPGMDGYQVCEQIKHHPVTQYIPVVFVTGQSDEHHEVKGLQHGAVDYITKPIRLPVLRARVRNQMLMSYYRKQLENISSTDGLTGIANRRQFDTMLSQQIFASVRRQEPLALLLIDIDDFKLYNDTFGHLEGDNCLKQVAQAIHQASMRTSDFAARFGGEEFSLLLSDTDLSGAQLVAQHVLDKVRELNLPHSHHSEQRIVTVSIGIAILDPDNLDRSQLQNQPECLIKQADVQLYEAKRLGKDRFCAPSLNSDANSEVCDSLKTIIP